MVMSSLNINSRIGSNYKSVRYQTWVSGEQTKQQDTGYLPLLCTQLFLFMCYFQVMKLKYKNLLKWLMTDCLDILQECSICGSHCVTSEFKVKLSYLL
jgi:hypothetical protein